MEWAQRAGENPFPYSRAESYSPWARPQYKLNQAVNSQATLATCAELIETKMPKIESGDLGGDWRDWIISHALLEEARRLIEGPKVPTATRTKNEMCTRACNPFDLTRTLSASTGSSS